MHANRIIDYIDLRGEEDFLHWFAGAGSDTLDPQTDFSQGQRQDLALAIFLARARGLGGTFFLDEPVTHLDDLNRVGLLDVIRSTAIECRNRMNLVITTASRVLARHMIEKFSRVSQVDSPDGPIPMLRVIELGGNGRTGLSVDYVFPAVRPTAAAFA